MQKHQSQKVIKVIICNQHHWNAKAAAFGNELVHYWHRPSGVVYMRPSRNLSRMKHAGHSVTPRETRPSISHSTNRWVFHHCTVAPPGVGISSGFYDLSAGSVWT